MDDLTSADAVAAGLGVTLPVEGSRDRDALDQAVTAASALVLGFLRLQSLAGFTDPARHAVQVCTRRVAQRLWRNPQDWVSSSANEASHSIDAPRLLTGDERAALRPYRARRAGRTVYLRPQPS